MSRWPSSFYPPLPPNLSVPVINSVPSVRASGHAKLRVSAMAVGLPRFRRLPAQMRDHIQP